MLRALKPRTIGTAMQTTECKLIVVFCGEESASNAKLDYAVFLILCTGAGGAMCDGVTLLKFSPTANSIDWVARQRMEQEDNVHADEHVFRRRRCRLCHDHATMLGHARHAMMEARK